MGEAKIGKFEKLNQKLVYSGKVLDLYTEAIKTPTGKEVEWVLVKTGGAAAVLALDEEQRIVLVRQYRNTINGISLEIPAGGLNKGEAPEKCAIRELKEETGHKAIKVEKLYSAYSTMGFCTEVIHYYLIECESGYEVELDPDEYVVVEKYTLEELEDLIFRGEIVDNKTVSAIMYYKAYLARK